MKSGEAVIPPRPRRPPRITGRGQRHPYVKERAAWVRDILVAAVVGAILLLGQARIDDARSDREAAAARLMAEQADRRENLRFVRERSSSDRVQRPYRGMDLAGQNLSALLLSGADLYGANLYGTDHSDTQLGAADLRRAQIGGANLAYAQLIEAYLSGSQLNFATLRGARLLRADLSGADLTRADLR